MNLNQTQREQLARVLDYLYTEEERDFIENINQDRSVRWHIFSDIKSLSDALGEFNSNPPCECTDCRLGRAGEEARSISEAAFGDCEVPCTCFISRSGKPVTLWCKEHKGE